MEYSLVCFVHWYMENKYKYNKIIFFKKYCCLVQYTIPPTLILDYIHFKEAARIFKYSPVDFKILTFQNQQGVKFMPPTD